jgi:hypothetical protein
LQLYREYQHVGELQCRGELVREGVDGREHRASELIGVTEPAMEAEMEYVKFLAEELRSTQSARP